MNKQNISLGTILGIPIRLDYSWLVIFVLLTWILATNYYPTQIKNAQLLQYWSLGISTTILLFISVLIHELGHSVIATRYKIPVRNITLFIFGGVSQIVSEPPNALAEFWIAIAGPAVSLVLAVLFTFMAFIINSLAYDAPLVILSRYLAFMNLSLAGFNLLPGFPLDGGRVLRAILWGALHNFRRATLIAAGAGQGIAFLFIAFGVWETLNGRIGNGLWIIFIGWFLDNAATAQIRQILMQGLLSGNSVSQAMIPINRLRVVQPDVELRLALDVMDRDRLDQLLVMNGDQVAGLLTRDGISAYLRKIR